MSPDIWVSLAREWGLPLAMLAAFAWAILKRKLVTGAESEGWRTLYERERLDRMAAEAKLAEFAPASRSLAEAVGELTKALPSPYDERLEGRRGR